MIKTIILLNKMMKIFHNVKTEFSKELKYEIKPKLKHIWHSYIHLSVLFTVLGLRKWFLSNFYYNTVKDLTFPNIFCCQLFPLLLPLNANVQSVHLIFWYLHANLLRGCVFPYNKYSDYIYWHNKKVKPVMNLNLMLFVAHLIPF